jgi:hypothetical protein
MTQEEVVDRMSSEILFSGLVPQDGSDWIKMYIAQAFAAGYEYRYRHEYFQETLKRRERAFP